MRSLTDEYLANTSNDALIGLIEGAVRFGEVCLDVRTPSGENIHIDRASARAILKREIAWFKEYEHDESGTDEEHTVAYCREKIARFQDALDAGADSSLRLSNETSEAYSRWGEGKDSDTREYWLNVYKDLLQRDRERCDATLLAEEADGETKLRMAEARKKAAA
jgi:hypothetical protein